MPHLVPWGWMPSTVQQTKRIAPAVPGPTREISHTTHVRPAPQYHRRGPYLQVRVRFPQIERDPETPCTDGTAGYRFYCPLHRGDNDPGVLIRVRP